MRPTRRPRFSPTGACSWPFPRRSDFPPWRPCGRGCARRTTTSARVYPDRTSKCSERGGSRCRRNGTPFHARLWITAGTRDGKRSTMTREAKRRRGSGAVRAARRHQVPLVLAVAVLGALAVIVGVLPNRPQGGSTEPVSEHAPNEALAGEFAKEAEQTQVREEALQQARRQGTLGLIEPLAVEAARGWRGQRLWRPKTDDWEPAVAGHPGSSRVYMLTTRFGGKPACRSCPDPALRLRASRDGGLHWGRDRYLCRCRGP